MVSGISVIEEWPCPTPNEGARAVGGIPELKVRIQSPPAESLRTIGPSAAASHGLGSVPVSYRHSCPCERLHRDRARRHEIGAFRREIGRRRSGGLRVAAARSDRLGQAAVHLEPRRLSRKHETCWYAVREGKSSHWGGDRRQTTVWEIANNNPFGNPQRELSCLASPHRPSIACSMTALLPASSRHTRRPLAYPPHQRPQGPLQR